MIVIIIESTIVLNMLKPRQLMLGTMPVGESLIGSAPPEVSPDDSQASEYEGIFECIVVVPVIARPDVFSKRNGWLDQTAEVVMGDITEEMSLSPFERTQAEYDGIDKRGTPVIGYDDVSAELYT
ncbi:MAG: hypothetical protein QG628_168 [Patescibacteria group bacterium]|jgi:hypothetical protein|nr:hypothetical protein [Patescibacteria group bacterium]